MLLWHIFLESSRGANVSAVTFHHIALGHQVICSSYAKLIEENFLNQQIVFFLETSSFKVELVSLNPSQIVFHSSINNLYYYNKTTSFQPLFIEYCIRLPLCTYLFQSSVPHPSLWALSHFPWLWLAHAEPLTALRLTVAVGLWGSLSIPDACTLRNAAVSLGFF